MTKFRAWNILWNLISQRAIWLGNLTIKLCRLPWLDTMLETWYSKSCCLQVIYRCPWQSSLWNCKTLIFYSNGFVSYSQKYISLDNSWFFCFLQGPFVSIDKFIEHMKKLTLPDGEWLLPFFILGDLYCIEGLVSVFCMRRNWLSRDKHTSNSMIKIFDDFGCHHVFGLDIVGHSWLFWPCGRVL